MIVVHAGHRIDRDSQERPRFPANRIGSVYRRSYLHLLERRPDAVVSAAANGADLLVLRAAEDLFIPFHVALPLPVEEFRRRSVDDRGQDWSEAFNRATQRATSVVTADLAAHDDWYIQGNNFILDVAEAESTQPKAIEGLVVMSTANEGGSATKDFAVKVSRRGWAIHHIDPLHD